MQFVAFDASYLERLQSRDPTTEAHFVAYFGELLRLKLRSRLRSKEAIEDVRQETFLRVFAVVRSDDGVRQPERLGALVNSVCNFVLLEHYRSKSRKDSTIDDEPESSFVDPDPSLATGLEIKDAQLNVRRILAELPERERRLLQAVLLEERDKDEVCAEMGLSREYLRVLVHRAKRRFEACYVSKPGQSDPAGKPKSRDV